jgi:hypothetical protein
MAVARLDAAGLQAWRVLVAAAQLNDVLVAEASGVRWGRVNAQAARPVMVPPRQWGRLLVQLERGGAYVRTCSASVGGLVRLPG